MPWRSRTPRPRRPPPSLRRPPRERPSDGWITGGLGARRRSPSPSVSCSGSGRRRTCGSTRPCRSTSPGCRSATSPTGSATTATRRCTTCCSTDGCRCSERATAPCARTLGSVRRRRVAVDVARSEAARWANGCVDRGGAARTQPVDAALRDRSAHVLAGRRACPRWLLAGDEGARRRRVWWLVGSRGHSHTPAHPLLGAVYLVAATVVLLALRMRSGTRGVPRSGSSSRSRSGASRSSRGFRRSLTRPPTPVLRGPSPCGRRRS